MNSIPRNSAQLTDHCYITDKGLTDQRREQAISLRRTGHSRREIKEILGISGNSTLDRALRGVPPPAWTLRPRAKDAVRARARTLREQGLDYEDIAAALGVSKSSVSLWVRDMPRPERLSPEQGRQRSAEGARLYWEAERPAREARRVAVRDAAAAEIGTLTAREIVIAGAIAYWCEGGKNKPHCRRDRVIFMNSDAAMITFFLRFLETVGVARERMVFRVQIHESGDVERAIRFWQEVTKAPADQFRRTSLKHHNPLTIRKNVGDTYHGCLRVEVRTSVDLYRKIEGWAQAAMAGPGGPVSHSRWGAEPG
jgi:transposase